MLQVIYIVAFSVLLLFAIANLVRSMIALSHRETEAVPFKGRPIRTLHPELLDASGKIINEPLLVVRSMDVEDVRSRLDALYESSPSAEY